MNQTRLQQLLSELHRELAAAGSLDADSRRMLEQVLADLRALDPAAGGGLAAAGPAAQLQDAALRLEAGHPRLAGALGQLGDALAKLGI